MEKFKKVSFELLDIGLHYGAKGVEKVKSMPLYQSIDQKYDLADKFELIQKNGIELYTKVNEKLSPILLSVYFLYDEQKNKITSFLKVITENRQQVVDYVQKTYSSVTVQIQENWMRLDFVDDNGRISKDELQNSMYGLYDFLRNYDLIEKTT